MRNFEKGALTVFCAIADLRKQFLKKLVIN